MTALAKFARERLTADLEWVTTVRELGEAYAREAIPNEMSGTDLIRQNPGIAGYLMGFMANPRAMRLMADQAESGVPAPNDLKRLEREIRAKLEIVANYEFWSAPGSAGSFALERADALEKVVRRLMIVYDEHPDYAP